MTEWTWLLALLALVLASSSTHTLQSRLSSLLALPQASWSLLSSLFGRTKAARIARIEALYADKDRRRLARLEKELHMLLKINQQQLSFFTTRAKLGTKPKHGKMTRDKCRPRDISYRLALGRPMIDHVNYGTKIALNYIRDTNSGSMRKALILAADYAARIPDDQIIKVIEMKKGKVKTVHVVKGRIPKIKVGDPSIGFAKICWMADKPDLQEIIGEEIRRSGIAA